MSIDRIVMAFSGGMIGLSLVLMVHSPYWLLAAFVGVNLFQAPLPDSAPWS